MASDRAQSVAEILVEADLMGHDTHGLALLGTYLDQIKQGGMTLEGEPDIVVDKGAVAVWDGKYLPGTWLTLRGLEAASAKAEKFGVGALTIKRSHHIACLQAYLPAITAKGQMAIICCSDPRHATVAPYGGLDPAFTPDPIACGIPTEGDPILIDVSASITTNGMASRLAAEGGRFPGKWVQDHDGNLSDDPAVLTGDRPGTLLPTGGQDHGHKGYALALMIETLSQAFSGFGRFEKPTTWGAAVFIQVFDPELFAGAGPFARQTEAIAEAARSSRPAPGVEAVRLPGQAALVRKRDRLAHGVPLLPVIEQKLLELSKESGASFPAPL